MRTGEHASGGAFVRRTGRGVDRAVVAAPAVRRKTSAPESWPVCEAPLAATVSRRGTLRDSTNVCSWATDWTD